ncbi:MAG: hypothetical protein J3Q66DRAFT_446095 [Benniella sp.]|nr:MAG: hypothetical protein J3Q66DRAFT_446095 [Benniella sp.]
MTGPGSWRHGLWLHLTTDLRTRSKDSFIKTVIPSSQKATQDMSQQLCSAFQSGMDDLVLVNSKDDSTIAASKAYVQRIAATVDTIQNTQVAQAQFGLTLRG